MKSLGHEPGLRKPLSRGAPDPGTGTLQPRPRKQQPEPETSTRDAPKLSNCAEPPPTPTDLNYLLGNLKPFQVARHKS